jgi:hypothetical protein
MVTKVTLDEEFIVQHFGCELYFKNLNRKWKYTWR